MSEANATEWENLSTISVSAAVRALIRENREFVDKKAATAAPFCSNVMASPGADGPDDMSKMAAFDVELIDPDSGQPTTVPALFRWATYHSKFLLLEKAFVDRDKLMKLIGCATVHLFTQIEVDAMTGSGVDANKVPTLIGLFGGAIGASDTYGGISGAVCLEWNASIQGNGGLRRKLTTDMMHWADEQIFRSTCRPWDRIVTDPVVTRRYAPLFTSDINAPSGLLWKGRSVVRNGHAPSGRLAFVTDSAVRAKWLPQRGDDIRTDRLMTQVPLHVSVTGNPKSGFVVALRTTLAMAVVRRGACSLILDIDETGPDELVGPPERTSPDRLARLLFDTDARVDAIMARVWDGLSPTEPVLDRAWQVETAIREDCIARAERMLKAKQ